MNECWTAEVNPPAAWANDGIGPGCVKGICRYDNAVLGYALLGEVEGGDGAATLGVPCDPYFEPPPPTYDINSVAGYAIAGAAIANTPKVLRRKADA